MNRRLPCTALIALGLLLQYSPAFGWGAVGHRVVALIAQERLQPKTIAAIGQILGPKTTIEDIASCADLIKSDSGNCGGLSLQKDVFTKSWHYIDIPDSATISVASSAPPLRQYPPCTQPAAGPTAKFLGDSMGACVEEQIRFDLQALKAPAPLPNPAATAEQNQQAAQDARRRKQLALMFLVHFLGDEHQPFHSWDDNDQGGNDKKVIFKTGGMAIPTSLHHLWNEMLDIRLLSLRPQQEATAKVPLELLRAIDQDMKYSHPESAAWISGDIPAAGAIDSYLAAKKTIVPDYKSRYDARLGVAVLDDRYADAMKPILFEQLERAGVRLAYLLNQTFEK